MSDKVGFHTRDRLYPIGYQARWLDDASGITFVSTICDATEPEGGPLFKVSVLPNGSSDDASDELQVALCKDADSAWHEAAAVSKCALTTMLLTMLLVTMLLTWKTLCFGCLFYLICLCGVVSLINKCSECIGQAGAIYK